MDFKWIILLLSLMLPVIIADIYTLKPNNSLTLPKSLNYRPRRHILGCDQPCGHGGGGGGGTVVVAVCCKGGAGQKEMFRNWWLHIALLLMPMSVSWLKAIFC